jgi:subtilisin family serine protease
VSASLVLAACGGGGGGSAPQADAAAEAPLADPSTRTAQSLSVPGNAAAGVVDKRLSRVTGSVDVWVTLSEPSVAAAAAQLASSQLSGTANEQSQTAKALKAAPQAMRDALRTHRSSVLSHQSAAAASLASLGAVELGRVNVAHNAIAVRVDASKLNAIAALPGVVKVRRVVNHEMSLSETVPYIGAAAAQASGFDGTGVRVAVLDSGIDYTHKNLGGPGTAAAYLAAYGEDPFDARNTTVDASLFPTQKVVGGFDFVGDLWPTYGDRTEDPNPIDFEGHGTHVADIIAGKSLDGTHKGVAPGAKLLAVRVCSAVATSCNGVAILKGLDYALDPNGDGDLSDAVDVINLSLGSSYGQIEDDSTLAVSTAVDLGVVVVVAAGNDANKPYIVSSPSIAPGAISVAQTAVPSASLYGLKVNSPAAIAGVYNNTATVDWAPIGAGFSGDVVAVGTACPGAVLPDLTGKVALIDRGTCSISLKVDLAGQAGAKGVLIGLIAPGDAVSFSYGGGTILPPTLVIQQSLSLAIKANIGAPVNVTVADGTKVPLVGSMASTSARGPSGAFQTIKPEIGAPGASVSAVAGSSDGQEAFGGTSGATPMVAGAAAILIGKYPTRTPLQIKSMLMNSASTQIYTNPGLLPGVLAPITRIGAGEVRVNTALALNAVAYSAENQSAALSFGAREVANIAEYEKKLVVENFGTSAKTFSVKSAFRYANDEASGAVSVQAPSSVKVAAKSKTTITIKLRVNPAKLPDWTLDSGAQGGSGDLLDKFEYDGYLTLTAGAEKLSVPWHILPRKAAEAGALLAQRANWPNGIILLANVGVAPSEFDVFALTGTSTKYPAADLPGAGDNFAVIDLRAVGVRYVAEEGALQFAINTFGRRAQANYPGGFEVDIDVNKDGVPDFAVFNTEQGAFASTGINVVNVQNLATGVTSIYYYNDVDFNSANLILNVPLAALGITPETQIDFTVLAYDNYFTGIVTDAISGMKFTPSKPRYAVSGNGSGVIRGHYLGYVGTTTVSGGAAASPSQNGYLVMTRRNVGTEAQVLIVK